MARFLQHKEEAYWFYRYLSIGYDHWINPWFYTPAMRDAGLELARLDRKDLDVVDVGAGTGFATEGIVRHVDPARVHALDQSDYQQARAKKKDTLRGVHFYLGDAEQLPWETDRFDRYVSSGSIEYWPDPQRAIAEAYRILKEGGTATILGPLKPEKSVIGRFLAETFMLFPTLEEYLAWYREAGFVDVQYRLLRPEWVTHEAYGLSIVGRKPKAGRSPWKAPTAAPAESLKEKTSSRKSRLLFLCRFAFGSLAGGLFVPIAVAKTAYARMRPKPAGMKCLPLLLMCATLAPTLAHAGEIYGSLTQHGNPVAAGVEVKIACPQQTTDTAKTDADGAYNLFAAQPGKCTLTVHGKSIEVFSSEKSMRYDLTLEDDGLKRK